MSEKTKGELKAEKEEYRDKIISIFRNMDCADRLRFWYRYISAIEKGEV